MFEALILVCELVAALLLVLAVKRADRDKDRCNLGFFSYRESASELSVAPKKKTAKTHA